MYTAGTGEWINILAIIQKEQSMQVINGLGESGDQLASMVCLMLVPPKCQRYGDGTRDIVD